VNRSLLRRWLPEARVGSVLKTDLFDEAFGEGLGEILAGRADEVHGIDVAEQVVEIVRERRTGLQVRCADVRRLPFADAVFDVVVSLSTLDHFSCRSDIARALSELQRVLKPGGLLVLTLDNLLNPVIALRNVLPFRPLRRIGIVPYYVGVTYGPRGLRRAVERAGFEVSVVTAVLHCPRVLAIPAAARVQRRAASTQERFVRALMRFERLACWPTRYITGHYVAVRALKR